MTSRAAFLAVLIALTGLAGWQLAAQDTAGYQDAGEAGNALRQANAALAQAKARGERLEVQARTATAAADRTASEAAVVAARIQQSEAEIAVAHAQIAMLDNQRDALRLRVAQRQEPVVRLTAALQLIARRPLAFSLMKPGSLRETVYLRAVLETMLPQVRRRTAGLRGEIARGRQLQQSAQAVSERLKASEVQLAARQHALAGMESRQRLESRSAQGVANREGDRALALAEETRDLAALMSRLEQDGALRDRLAALPGPVLRPERPGEVLIVPDSGPVRSAAGFSWILPVAGRLVGGFGENAAGGASSGITFAAPAGAQIIAPAPGRVAFAGVYRGYGRIVIIEHAGGWTTLVTGLGRITPAIGDAVVQGSPLGNAGPGRPTVSVELRKDGAPVNPMGMLRG